MRTVEYTFPVKSDQIAVMRKRRDQSFGKHYLKHVALGEGCNCAESMLRTFDRSPAKGDDPASIGAAAGAWLARLLRGLRRGG